MRAVTPGHQEGPVDQLIKDAQRLVSIGTFFIIAGWVFVIYAIVAGVHFLNASAASPAALASSSRSRPPG